MNEVGTVELVLQDGLIKTEIFPIPTYCSYLTEQTRNKIEAKAVDLEFGNHRAKIRTFVKAAVTDYKQEMMSQ